jgi:hypothetical protein
MTDHIAASTAPTAAPTARLTALDRSSLPADFGRLISFNNVDVGKLYYALSTNRRVFLKMRVTAKSDIERRGIIQNEYVYIHGINLEDGLPIRLTTCEQPNRRNGCWEFYLIQGHVYGGKKRSHKRRNKSRRLKTRRRS